MTNRVVVSLLAVLALGLGVSCQPPPLTQSRLQTGIANLVIISEMREEGSTIWAINPADLLDKRLLASFPHQSGFPLRGAISPDGRSMALVQLPPGAERFSGARVVVMNKDGTGQRTLEDGIDYDITPLWSPDSRELVFVKRSGQPQAPGGAPGAAEVPPPAPSAEVYAVGSDGNNRRLLFKDAQSLDLYLVAWQKDGKRVILRRFLTTGDELWALDLAGSPLQRLSVLSRTPAYGVGLSPDGASVIASVRQDDSSYDVISQSMDGQSRRVLSKGNRRPSNAIFAPDGRRIAIDVEPPQQGAALGIMEAGADTITRLSSPSGGKEVPLTFSPDGEWLLVRHLQEGRARALILRIRDGTKEYLETAYWVEPIGWTKG